MTFHPFGPQPAAGITVVVPAPTGAVGTDTPTVKNAITALAAAVGRGPATLQFQDGTYVIDAGAFVVQSLSNFTITGTGAESTVIQLAANRTGQYNTNGDLAVIADCTDFTVTRMRFDWNRDTVAPLTAITASASSGQPSVTVAAGQGARYLATQRLQVYGGLGTGDQSKSDTGAGGAGLTILSITPGGGSGGGDLITFTTNLTNTYTSVGGTAVSDGLGPYAMNGAYVSPYQTGSNFTAAGRTLGNEDTQNGLHLLSCQRFLIEAVDARNTWESQIKTGTGFASTNVTDGCSYGVITGCLVQHGYDQGVSVWNSQFITVTACKTQASGWAGISLSHSNDCTVTGNVCQGQIFSPASDLNEGTGIAVEGGVRCVAVGNACPGNNSNGIRLNISPMFGGAALSQGTTGSISAGATSITMTSSNSNMVNGASFTIVDPNNAMIRETIYCSGSVTTTLSLSVGTRNAYASGATIFARFGQDVTVANNTCARSALSAGVSANQQIGLKIFANDCSENGFLNGSFQDTLGTYGIYLTNAQEALVQGNTCSYNSEEGIFVDNGSQAAQIVDNSCSHNGIKGTNQKNGIKLNGLVDGAIRGNECNFNTASGIYSQDGTATSAHCVYEGNTCMNNNTAGIFLDNGGTTASVTSNKIAYNGDAGMKILGYSSSTFVANECYNQAGQEGIRFDAGSSSRHCTKNTVGNNLLFDDQGSPSQSWGFKDTGDASTGTNTITYNRAFGNTNAGQLSTQGTDTLTGNIIS